MDTGQALSNSSKNRRVKTINEVLGQNIRLYRLGSGVMLSRSLSGVSQHERNMREGEARLPLEEQLSLKLRRFIEANIPELTVKVPCCAISASSSRMRFSIASRSSVFCGFSMSRALISPRSVAIQEFAATIVRARLTKPRHL